MSLNSSLDNALPGYHKKEDLVVILKLNFSLLAILAMVVVFLGAMPVRAADWEMVQIKDEYANDITSPTQIEKAYKECLVQMDEELAELKAGSNFKREHRKSEAALCERNRQGCVNNPKSAECHGFVDDYAHSSDE